jgi:hypothetical protein
MTVDRDISEEFVQRDATASMLTANLVAVPFMVLVSLFFFAAYILLWGWEGVAQAVENSLGSVLFWGGVVLGFVVHEGLHALGWYLAAGVSWDAFKFGIKDLTPYAHVKVPLPVGPYRLGTALPGVALGLLPGLVGLLLENGPLAMWGLLFTSAAGGDALIIWLLRRAPPGSLVRDHPERAGCELLVPRSSVEGADEG